VTQLTQFVGHDVINKNTTDLAVRCSTDSVEFSCVAINTPLGLRLLFSYYAPRLRRGGPGVGRGKGKEIDKNRG